MNNVSKKCLSGKHAELLDEGFGYTNSFWEFKLDGGRMVLPENFSQMIERIRECEVREDDVWVISYPKTGSTWLQEMVWLIGNQLDFERAKTIMQQLRAPMIELSIYFAQYEEYLEKFGDSVTMCANTPSPRFIKSHLMCEFLPKQIETQKPKIIYMARHPKDLCVSYYHHCRMMYNVDMSFDNFADMFLSGNAPIGDVFDHYLAYWKRRDDENLLFLKYEDFVRDPRRGIDTLARFIGKPLVAEDVDKICEFLTVENMRNNPGCNFELLIGSNLVRKGIVGDWKNYMNDELSARFDKWIAKRLQGTGLSFD